MTTKLVSANMGIVLIVERDGEQKKLEFSMVCPSKEVPQPHDALFYLKEFLDKVFDTDIDQVHVQIAKPKRQLKHRPVTQDTFNKKIKELGY